MYSSASENRNVSGIFLRKSFSESPIVITSVRTKSYTVPYPLYRIWYECSMEVALSGSLIPSASTDKPLISPILASEPAAGHQLCGDDVALDFVGAFADDHQRGVAKVALDVVFGGIAVAAVDANRVERDLHRHLGGEQLGHPGLHVAALAAVVAFGGVAGQLAGRGQLGRHVGQVVADRLVFPDRLAEALPLLGVGQRIVEGRGGHPQCPGCDLNTARLKAFHHLRKALARIAAQNRGVRRP